MQVNKCRPSVFIHVPLVADSVSGYKLWNSLVFLSYLIENFSTNDGAVNLFPSKTNIVQPSGKHSNSPSPIMHDPSHRVYAPSFALYSTTISLTAMSSKIACLTTSSYNWIREKNSARDTLWLFFECLHDHSVRSVHVNSNHRNSICPGKFKEPQIFKSHLKDSPLKIYQYLLAVIYIRNTELNRLRTLLHTEIWKAHLTITAAVAWRPITLRVASPFC